MADLIQLLPDVVANQIAAGEVVQRPASAVKELMENAVDSGANNVKLIIRDAGKALIQIIDDGCGMSERDARMCFERHATSKIRNADDLLAIRTLGFRGEALASIASVAQVELKTKREQDEVGTSIRIEGSEIKDQSPVTTPTGTSIAVKNLFFNVPARRNFLKSNTLEYKYILEEFFRVAYVNTTVGFSFYNNDKLVYQIPPSNLKQRLVNLLGQNYSQRLVPVEQETNVVTITGFIGKPEFAKKTRGEQYFFANGRFIKNAYLHHSVENAFRELIPSDSFPTYFLYLSVDPQTIDINIHPTKTEINFQDSKSIYAILHAAVRKAIGKFNITPTLDFETEKSIALDSLPEDAPVRQPVIIINPDYNPFERKENRQQEMHMIYRDNPGTKDWQKLMDPLKNIRSRENSGEPFSQNILSRWDDTDNAPRNFRNFQIRNRFILTHTMSGIVIIDQQNAHERILYERFISCLENAQPAPQHQLIPQKVEVSEEDMELINEHQEEFTKAGFDISAFGRNTILVNAIPSGISNSDIRGIVEKMIENLKINLLEKENKPCIQVARTLARSMAVSRNQKLQQEEINAIVEQLFACNVPDITPDGKPVMNVISYDELNRKFK